MTTDYTREELISICEAAIVPISKWLNREAPYSQEQLGLCATMLKCGAEFFISHAGRTATNDKTIWVAVHWPSFNDMEQGHKEWNSVSDTFYLPTRQRLANANGGDWY